MCALALSSGTFHILTEPVLTEISYPCLLSVLLQAKDCDSILISQAALTDSLRNLSNTLDPFLSFCSLYPLDCLSKGT